MLIDVLVFIVIIAGMIKTILVNYRHVLSVIIYSEYIRHRQNKRSK